MTAAPARPRLATTWLDGCSGCHMSFLDLDDRLVELGRRADLVYSPLVDVKVYPHDVDVCRHTRCVRIASHRTKLGTRGDQLIDDVTPNVSGGAGDEDAIH